MHAHTRLYAYMHAHGDGIYKQHQATATASCKPRTCVCSSSQYGASQFSDEAGPVAGLGTMTSDSAAAIAAINANTWQVGYTNTDSGLSEW